jgi:uncharacterized oxidoreductase
MDTRGNTILITGGSSGIGLALARAFLARGNTVLACGRNATRLEKARDELPELNTLICDISDPHDQDRLHSWVREQFPRLNVLVNNAGIANRMDFAADGIDTEVLEREIATNFLAPVRLVSRFLPMLRKQPNAAIINVTAVLAYAPIASLPVHSATKAALRSFTRSLRRQLGDGVVRVIEIVPPVVDTPMQRSLNVPKVDPDVFVERVLARVARGDQDIHVGPAKAFRLGSRLAPELLFRMLNHTVERSSPGSGAEPEAVRLPEHYCSQVRRPVQ